MILPPEERQRIAERAERVVRLVEKARSADPLVGGWNWLNDEELTFLHATVPMVAQAYLDVLASFAAVEQERDEAILAHGYLDKGFSRAISRLDRATDELVLLRPIAEAAKKHRDSRRGLRGHADKGTLSMKEWHGEILDKALETWQQAQEDRT
jgi:hypothetical protein